MLDTIVLVIFAILGVISYLGYRFGDFDRMTYTDHAEVFNKYPAKRRTR